MPRHDIGEHCGVCDIYTSLDNYGRSEAGVCTCGEGLRHMTRTEGDTSHLYSRELRLKMALECRSRGRENRVTKRQLMEMLFGKRSIE